MRIVFRFTYVIVRGRAVVSTSIAQMPASSPSTPPSAASNVLSTSNCRAMRIPPAPSAARIAISRPRPAARISIRLATLAQAISRTTPTAPSNTSSGVRTSPTTCSRRSTTVIPHLVLKSGRSHWSWLAMTFMSAWALEIVAPSRSLATVWR